MLTKQQLNEANIGLDLLEAYPWRSLSSPSLDLLFQHFDEVPDKVEAYQTLITCCHTFAEIMMIFIQLVPPTRGSARGCFARARALAETQRELENVLSARDVFYGKDFEEIEKDPEGDFAILNRYRQMLLPTAA